MPIGQLGMLALSTAAGMGMQGIADERQRRQQRWLQELQIHGNKQMLEAQKAKELEMWKATSYPAQMAMMKQAGLNPSLMYGMGGGGGTTVGGGGAGVSGGMAPSGGGEISGAIGMGMGMKAQIELLQAQKENIQADTQNKLGDAANKPKVGANLEASTASLTQGIENQKAQERLTIIEGYLADTELEIKGKTKEDAIRLVSQEVEMADNQIKAMKRENWVDDATARDRIQIVRTRLAGMLLENLLTDAKITLTKEETWAVAKRIGAMQEGLYWEGKSQGVNERESDNRRRMNDVAESEKVPLEIMEKIIQAVGLGAGMKEAGRQQGRNDERYERYKDWRKTKDLFGN